MQTTSALYKSILASAHMVEWKVVIGGTSYGQDVIVLKIGGTDRAPKISHQMFSDNAPAIGKCVAGTFDVTMLLASSAIPRMAEVKPYYRLCGGSSNSEWYPAGVYYVDVRQADEATETVALECYDAILKLTGSGGKSYADITAITTWPQPMSVVASEIATIIGVSIDSRTVINSGAAYMVEYPNDLTMREVMGYIAAAHGGNWTMTPEGKARLVPLTGTSMTPIALAKGMSDLKVIPAYKAWSRVTLYYGDEAAYTSGNDTGMELVADEPWALQGTADGILSMLSGTTYQPFSAHDSVSDLAFELGDKVSFTSGSASITAVVWSIGITCDSKEHPDLSAPGDQEIDHEYPYTDYVDRSLKRKVALGQSYYGTSISREKGIEIKRSDGTSEALFNSDVFQMSALKDGVMTPRIYFDPLKGDYVFDGALGADAVFTDSLYAEQGDVAELTVDRLSTSRRVRLYNLQNTGDDNYVEIQDNYLRFVTGTPIEDPDNPGTYLTEQATNRYGQALYWSDEPDSINAQGYPLDEDGNQIYATTDTTDWPVTVYQYTELVKAQFAFESESGTYVPILTLGAGDNQGNSKGYLYKGVDALLLQYLDSAGDTVQISLGDDGYVDIYQLRRATELDFSMWSSGTFTETLDGGVFAAYNVDFDSNGRPIRIYDTDHSCDIVW